MYTHVTLYILYLSTALPTVQVQVHFIYIIQNKVKLIIINLTNSFESRQQILQTHMGDQLFTIWKALYLLHSF